MLQATEHKAVCTVGEKKFELFDELHIVHPFIQVPFIQVSVRRLKIANSKYDFTLKHASIVLVM